MQATLLAPVLAALAPFVAPPAVQAGDPPSVREQRDLVEEYFTHDPRTAAGFSARMDLVRRLDAIALERRSKTRRWTGRIEDEAGDRRRMEPGSGLHWWWEEPERRGKFLVGGETRRPEGLLVGFHGGGAGSGSAESSHASLHRAARELGLVAIFPEVLEKTEHGWTDAGTEEWVMDLVGAALRTWDLDPARVYFAGHSMGGYGSWTLGAHHADRIAAAAPSAGAPTPVFGPDGDVIEIDAGVVPNLRNLPMVVYQSADDPRVPPVANRAAVREVAKARGRWGGYEHFEYWEVDGRGHGGPPGGMLALLEKIVAHRRNAVPDKVVWQPVLAWKRQFYWLWWPEPKAGAVVVAELDREANAVRLSSDAGLDGMEVLLDERIARLDEAFRVFVNGEERWSGMPRPTLGTLLLTSSAGDPELRFRARVPVGGRPAAGNADAATD